MTIIVTIPVDQDARQMMGTRKMHIEHFWAYPENIVHPNDYEFELECFFNNSNHQSHEIYTMSEVILTWVRVYIREHNQQGLVQYVYADKHIEEMPIDSDGRCEYYDPCMRKNTEALRRLL